MKEYIKKKAKEQGISLQDIAKELGLASYPSFLRTIETGDNLKTKQLKVIAKMIGCTIDELVNGKDCNSGTELSIKCEKCGNVIKIKEIKVEQ